MSQREQQRHQTPTQVHRWAVFEAALDVSGIRDPLRDVTVTGEFIGPSGRRRSAPGFWDGGETYRVRFAPDEVGTWRFTLRAGGRSNVSIEGRFECVPYLGNNRLYQHGPPRLSKDRTHLVHAGGPPFFFLGDTVWNGPMRAATEEDWRSYVQTRREQGFTAALYVTTSWKGLPDGGPDGPSHTGIPDRVETVNARFYQRLDRALDTLVAAGIVGAPVLLWANPGGPEINPGLSLPEDDAILLARYQIARWHAHPVVWILNGDGRYTGEHAPRWHHIGRAAFADNDAGIPVALHAAGLQWLGDDFKDEPWVDILGCQSGHRGNETAWRWLAGTPTTPESRDPGTRERSRAAAQGPGEPARSWRDAPGKIVMNLEPCYEHHNRMELARTQGVFKRFTAEDVRRALYWSLLIAPTAGVVYGGHGVWGWDEGTEPPIAHPLTGTPYRWSEALHLPGAGQVSHLRTAFESLDWWTLRPDEDLVREQPGEQNVLHTIRAARSEDGHAAVVYAPAGGRVALDLSRIKPDIAATWIDPRTGSIYPASLPANECEGIFDAPSADDWLLMLKTTHLSGEGA